MREVRARRDGARARKALGELEAAARSDDNTVPAILACVEAYCTTGEIADTLRSVFGEHRHDATV